MLVPQAVFGALGVHDLSAGLSLSSLAGYLGGKRLLLVLDNCEHLLDACATLAGTLLAACPDVHILATSRQALGVAGEVRMVVPPMSLPAEADDTSVQSLLGCDSVWLLSERAAAASPGFTVDAANAGQVLLLCRKLDGIPLALELAAVRLASLSLEQLNEGLASELSILGVANRGAEARQQTLEAAIGWSYGLLDERERLLWARLSAFAGGFQEDAAMQVCTDERIPAGRIPGLLGALVDKSILKRQLSGRRPAPLLAAGDHAPVRPGPAERGRRNGYDRQAALRLDLRAGPAGRSLGWQATGDVRAHGQRARQPMGGAGFLLPAA
jgi:predicted ATPase